MAAAASSLQWSLVQAFLAVAERGSLSAAARLLGATQPTLGRQIKAMEDQLGAELFQRHGQGLALTEAGQALLASARQMRQAAHDIELLATGKSQALSGTVRITASVIVATHHLPRIVAAARQREPSIAIEVAAANESSNLHFREADIAVRMYRPEQLALVARHLGDLRLGMFAAKSYVERRGVPETAEQLLEHDVVGFDRQDAIVQGFRRGGLEVSREWFKVRCDHDGAYWGLVRAGCGLGFGQRVIGLADPTLVEVPLQMELPVLPLWLTAHEAVHKTPRVHVVWEALANGLSALCE